jgi:hypothetical protein
MVAYIIGGNDVELFAVLFREAIDRSALGNYNRAIKMGR